MVLNIETNRKPDGQWIAEVPVLPGLQVYEHSQEAVLASARKLMAILLYRGEENQRILAFYPGRIPDSTAVAMQS
ncbi:MAG: type II toxin-antitoxin system HicB family antitoxin [Acidobacteriota bacterium]|nr:type II toxin-antitoxin system HicB family antitoxin [Acidobacteriota bacterium]